MKTKQIITFFTFGIILFGGLMCKNITAQDNYSEEQIRKVIKVFYTNYIEANSELNPQKADSIKNEYCTPNLINYINTQFEEGRLDYDPFLDSQMIDKTMLENFRVIKDSINNKIYYFSYYRPYYKKFINIKLAICRKENFYKIDSIFIKFNHEMNPN